MPMQSLFWREPDGFVCNRDFVYQMKYQTGLKDTPSCSTHLRYRTLKRLRTIRNKMKFRSLSGNCIVIVKLNKYFEKTM